MYQDDNSGFHAFQVTSTQQTLRLSGSLRRKLLLVTSYRSTIWLLEIYSQLTLRVRTKLQYSRFYEWALQYKAPLVLHTRAQVQR